MAGRRTNLALLALTTVAVLSGFAAFSVGTATGQWVVVAHGVVGLGILVLAPWKAMIARRGMARRLRPSRWISISLSIAATVTVASGVALITGLWSGLGPFTPMQVHVGGGLVTLALTTVHLAQRPVRPRTADLSRRNALRAAGLLGAAGALYAGGEALLSASGAPGGERRFTGSHEVDASSPVPPTQWLNDRIPSLSREDHVVAIAGRSVDVEFISSFGDDIEATIDCTGGWHATRVWSGARLDHLIEGASGESLVVRSVTGYWRRFPLTQADMLWLATGIDGEELAAGNGAPVRLVAPGRRGFWWVKWVASIEIDNLPSWWQPPLPLA